MSKCRIARLDPYGSACFILCSTCSNAKDVSDVEVKNFFAVLHKEKSTRSDFVKIFGPYNEAEVAVALHKKFPDLDISTDLSRNQHVIDYIENIDFNSNEDKSDFFECIKKTYPSFVTKSYRILGIAKSLSIDNKSYWVLVGKKKYKFEYNQLGYLNNIFITKNIDLYQSINSCNGG